MTKKRGRKPKPWFEILRVTLWYREVISSSGYTNPILDDEFAWVNGKDHLADSSDQPRMFELIEKKCRVPTGQDPRFRNMEQLLNVMELDPRFKGLKGIYHSIFWDLIQQKISRPSDVVLHIRNIMDECSLVRLPLEKFLKSPDLTPKIREKYSSTHIYNKCLDQSTRGMGALTVMSFLWLLYLENEPSHNHQIRSLLEEKIDAIADRFFDTHRVGKQFEIYTKVISELINSKLDLTGYHSYPAGFESQGIWPIIPANLVGEIDDDFFSKIVMYRIA